MSTRPDYISEAVLKRMKKYGVDMIELGVQSFDDEVLKLSRRGHDSETVFRSARLIKEAGIDLGIQLMTGLPADSREKCIVSARRAVQTGPCAVRIYPTVVLRRTELYQMYLRGEYRPPGARIIGRSTTMSGASSAVPPLLLANLHDYGDVGREGFVRHLIFNPGISGFASISSSSFTIERVPCLYFRKCGVCRWLS